MCFLECFWGFFLVFGKEKKCRQKLDREKILEKCVSPWSGACLGLFITPSVKIEAAALVGPQP